MDGVTMGLATVRMPTKRTSNSIQWVTKGLMYERTEEGVDIDRHSGEIQLAQEYKPGKYKIAGKPRYIILAYHGTD